MATIRPSSAIPPLLKDLNERQVLETIRSSAPISRAEISRRAGISKPTVSTALQNLLEAGLVRESEHSPTGPRYGAVFFEPVPDAALVLGIDLGARFLRGAMCDLDGTIRARQDVEIGGLDADGALDAIAELCESIIEAANLPHAKIDGAVVGVPGTVDTDTGAIELVSMRGLQGRRFGAELGERLNLPVAMENDINLSAVGEHWAGVARGIDDFVFLSVGTGTGAGVMLRGELHRGRHGAAGEIDLVASGRDDDIDPSASAVSALAERMAESRSDTSLRAPFEVREIFGAARAGDAVAQDVVDEVARRIAQHIVALAGALDVTPVVLGGGIGANADLLLAPIQRLLDKWLPYPPRVEVSSLGEAAVLTGALAVGLRSALDSVFVNRVRASAPSAPA
ncbi:MAG TPA: ROK family transcriptional regulator [Egibacteraceae bacterium]|nr:ROK family transcriptional regulator [Egibacteraceae bacterium]